MTRTIRPDAAQAGTHIMGWVINTEMAATWPSSRGDYAAALNTVPKVVFNEWAQADPSGTHLLDSAHSAGLAT